jgi:hypothetical protein
MGQIHSIFQLEKPLQSGGQSCRKLRPGENLASRSEAHRPHAFHDRVSVFAQVAARCIEKHAKRKLKSARSEHIPEQLVRDILLPTACLLLIIIIIRATPLSDHAPVHGNRGRKVGLPTDVRGGVVGGISNGTRLERLAVDPIPPGWPSNAGTEQCYHSWVEEIVAFYGDVKPSMLQDFERGRKTEVDFINGYVVTLGYASGVPVHMNAAITDLVHQIERGVLQPTRDRMNDLAN